MLPQVMQTAPIAKGYRAKWCRAKAREHGKLKRISSELPKAHLSATRDAEQGAEQKDTDFLKLLFVQIIRSARMQTSSMISYIISSEYL